MELANTIWFTENPALKKNELLYFIEVETKKMN